MSANHTQMPASSYLALEAELLALQEGNTPIMRAAEQKIKQSLEQMKSRSREHLAKLSSQRRQNVEAIRQASDSLQSAISDLQSHTDSLDAHMNALDAAVTVATGKVDAILSQMRQQYVTGAELYAELSSQFTLSQLNPDYQKFASEQLLDLSERIAAIGQHELDGASMNAMVINAMHAMFMMDIVVAKQQSRYELQHTEAISLAEKILAHIENCKENEIDVNFWTDGRMKLVEEKVSEIKEMILRGRYDSSYSQKMLGDDLASLKEMDKIQEQLAAEGIEAQKHSLNREAQAQTCADILADHGYEIVGSGFDHGDSREAYILRMRRHTSGAEVEVIVNQGEKPGEYDVYFRIDSTTYMDEKTMKTLTESIADEFREAGVSMSMFRHCTAEILEPFDSSKISMSDAARRRHAIPKRKIMREI